MIKTQDALALCDGVIAGSKVTNLMDWQRCAEHIRRELLNLDAQTTIEAKPAGHATALTESVESFSIYKGLCVSTSGCRAAHKCLGPCVEIEKAEQRADFSKLADKIIADYIEHYSFHSDAAESHMHDCITDALDDPVATAPNVSEKMVSRFLSWPLPNDFTPDCGVTFTQINRPHMWPSGTNLLNANQARQMLEYVLAADE